MTEGKIRWKKHNTFLQITVNIPLNFRLRQHQCNTKRIKKTDVLSFTFRLAKLVRSEGGGGRSTGLPRLLLKHRVERRPPDPLHLSAARFPAAPHRPQNLPRENDRPQPGCDSGCRRGAGSRAAVSAKPPAGERGGGGLQGRRPPHRRSRRRRGKGTRADRRAPRLNPSRPPPHTARRPRSSAGPGCGPGTAAYPSRAQPGLPQPWHPRGELPAPGSRRRAPLWS